MTIQKTEFLPNLTIDSSLDPETPISQLQELAKIKENFMRYNKIVDQAIDKIKNANSLINLNAAGLLEIS